MDAPVWFCVRQPQKCLEEVLLSSSSLLSLFKGLRFQQTHLYFINFHLFRSASSGSQADLHKLSNLNLAGTGNPISPGK